MNANRILEINQHEIVDPNISVETGKYHIPNTLPGLYTERLVVNNTTAPIVIIDRDGSTTTIPPICHSKAPNMRGVFVLIRNSTAASRDEFVPEMDAEWVMPQRVTEIEPPKVFKYFAAEFQIMQGYHWKAHDLYICTEEDFINDTSGKHVHPEAVGNYADIVTETIRDVFGKSNSLHITINDPCITAEHIDKVYCNMFGHVLEVFTTNLPKAHGEMTLEILCNEGGKQKVLLSETVEELRSLESGKEWVCIKDRQSDLVISLALTRFHCVQGYKSCATKTLHFDPDNVDSQVKEYVDEQLADLQSEIRRLRASLATAQEEIRLKDAEIKVKTTELNALQGYRKTEAFMTQAELQRENMEGKVKEQEHKTRRAEVATTTEIVKSIPTTVKVVAGVIAGMAAVAAISIVNPAAGLMSLFCI